MTTVHVVLPEGIDDVHRPTGGNVYDRHLCAGLVALGWSVREHAVRGSWPDPDSVAYAALAGVLAGLPDHSVVLLDGLVACAAAEVLLPVAERLRLVVLVHMPLGSDPARAAQEGTALRAAAAVVVTSEWSRGLLQELYALPAGWIHVAHPGVASAAPSRATSAGGRLLCVAAVIPPKGHDVLLTALAGLADLRWTCVCVGSLTRDPDHVEDLRRHAARDGISDRVTFTGPLVGTHLDGAYASADLLVLASRSETYGMVVTEALARGLPVVATTAGGLGEALGAAPDGVRPGLLVPPDDPAALQAALRSWLTDAEVRDRLRTAALARRATLTGWEDTTRRVAAALAGATG